VISTERCDIKTIFVSFLRSVVRLIEIGKCYGMEMNVEKTKVMRISRQPSPVTIM